MKALRDILTRREMQVAELLAWGASKKEVPGLLPRRCGREISVHTVENITRSIFSKLHIQKVSELSAAWFCSQFGISMDLSPMRRKILSMVFLVLLLPQLITTSDIIRPQRAARITRTVRATRARRRSEDTLYL